MTRWRGERFREAGARAAGGRGGVRERGAGADHEWWTLADRRVVVVAGGGWDAERVAR